MGQSDYYRDDDLFSDGRPGRPRSPEIDESVLASFDPTKQKISNLIVGKDVLVDLSAQSVPVRESLQANFGVSYIENTTDGGSVNVKISGRSYHEQPGLTMRKEALESKQ